MSTSTVRKFGVGIASLALVASAAVPAFAANEAPRPLTGGWDRIASDKAVNDRIDTAIAVARTAYSDKAAQVVYVANSNATIDAAAAGQLTDGPILLVNSDSRVIEQVKAEIATYTSAKTVYALGGTTVVSDDTLKAVADKKATGRLGGADRYATARAIADRVVSVNPEKGKVVYISRGDVAIDALTAGALDEGPVLLLENGKVPASAKEYLEAKKPTKVIGLGGETVVPNAALSEAQLPGIKVNPGTGYDAYAKALAEFNQARIQYLGFNSYAGDTLNLVEGAKAGKSGEPKDTNLAESNGRALTDAEALRWMGYKAQSEVLTQRKTNVVDNVVTQLKASATTELFNKTQAGQNGWATYSATAKDASSLVYKAVLALYGVKLVDANLSEKQFVMDKDKNVTGIAWDEFAKLAPYAANVDRAKEEIKVYRDKKVQATLEAATGYNATPNAFVAASNVLALKADLVSTDLDSLDGSGAAVMLVKYTLDELVKIADSNASTTKTAMESAAAKLRTGQNYYRLAGADRYETAVEISKYRRAGGNFGLGKNDISKSGNLNNVYIANGVTMVDALVGGVLTNGPILLADEKGNLSDKTKEELRNIGATHTTVRDNVPFVLLIGGKVAVPDSTGTAAAAEIKAGNAAKPAASTPSVTLNPLSYTGSKVDITSDQATTANPVVGSTTDGATYSIVDLVVTDISGTTVTVDNAGVVTVTDGAYAGANAKTGTFKVRTLKDGKYVDSATITINSKRA
ncbi:MAG: cell wall-binding repeat-containing protein [Actinomycetaceae bacterium]|nr:cell wall-binding repeat-containing protein [Actinomycetaceae bacterium]